MLPISVTRMGHLATFDSPSDWEANVAIKGSGGFAGITFKPV